MIDTIKLLLHIYNEEKIPADFVMDYIKKTYKTEIVKRCYAVNLPSWDRKINIYPENNFFAVEFSVSKAYFGGHNIGRIDVNQALQVIRDLYLAIKFFGIETNHPKEWKIARIDISTTWKLEESQIPQVIEKLKVYNKVKKLKQRSYTDETIIWKTPDSQTAIKVYNKELEMKQHDLPEIRKDLSNYPYNVKFDYLTGLEELSKNVIVFEVMLRERVLKGFFGKAQLTVKDLMGYNDLDERLQDLIYKVIPINMTISTEEVFIKLQKQFPQDSAISIYKNYLLMISTNPVEKVIWNKLLTRQHRYQVRTRLKKAGISTKEYGKEMADDKKRFNWDLKDPRRITPQNSIWNQLLNSPFKPVKVQ